MGKGPLNRFIGFQPLVDRVKIGTCKDNHTFRSTELLQLPWNTWLLPASGCADLSNFLLHLD